MITFFLTKVYHLKKPIMPNPKNKFQPVKHKFKHVYIYAYTIGIP